MTDDPTLHDPHRPVLIVTGTSHDGDSLVLDTQGFDKLLGSGPDCHLRLDAGNIDFHHARVLWEERGVFLSDEGSSTGTYVNGERIGSDHPLEDGDRICLGPPGSRNSVKLLIRVPTEIAEAQTIVLSLGNLAKAELDQPAPAAAPLPPLQLEPVPELVSPVLLEPVPADPEPELSDPIVLDAEPFEAEDAVFVAEPEPAFTLPMAPPPVPAPVPPPVAEAPSPPPAAAPPVPPLAQPAAASPPPLPPAPPPPLPSLAERARARPDYAPELPSIVRDDAEEGGEGTRADAPRPEAALRRISKKRPAKPPRAPLPKPLLMAVGGAVLVAAAVTAFWMFRKPGPAASTAAGATPGQPAVPAGMPVITALQPDVALPGGDVIVIGTNVGGPGVKVDVAGMPATVHEASMGRVRFRVPQLPVVVEGQSVSVVVRLGANASRPADLYLGRLPLVSEAAPKTGEPGDKVVVKGRGFDPNPAGNRVTFGEDVALVVAAAPTELAVLVPAPASSLNRVDVPVIVRRGASTSGDSIIFNITRPAAGIFKLRFFAGAVEGDATAAHAFVGTELGPVLLLTGPGTASTVADRAMATADALNALVGQSPHFEVRSGSAVAVTGGAAPLVSALPSDVTGYSKPFDPVMAGQQSNPSIIASYWAALLQDLFVLFGKGDRPNRVVELSPRGKVLMDLFSETERRLGRGQGVPSNLVSPPTWTVAKAFREMALALPTRGAALPAAAVAGRWEGTMVETGSVEKALRLELRLEGARLVGSMSTDAGGITMNTLLRDLTYGNGTLSFTLIGGQTPRRVQGTVNGTRLDGTIQAAPGVAPGRISLRYVE